MTSTMRSIGEPKRDEGTAYRAAVLLVMIIILSPIAGLSAGWGLRAFLWAAGLG